MELRRGRSEDAERLAWVHLRAWQQAYAGLIPASYLNGLMDRLAERTERWREWLSAPRPAVAVAVVDSDEPIGFAV